MIRRLLLASAVLSLAFADFARGAAPASAPKVTAENPGEFDFKTGEALLTGHPAIEYDGYLLLGDEIRYNSKTQIATARGHVSLTRGSQRLIADEIVMNMAERVATAKHVRLGQSPLYLAADHLTVTRDHASGGDVVASYHEPSPYSPILKAGTIDYEANNLRAENARIGFSDAMPIRLPHFQQSVHDPLLSYLTGNAGYRGSLGAMLAVGAEVPFYPGVKAGGSLDFFSKRGLLVRPSAAYNTNLDGEEITGSLRTGFIHDYGDRLTDVLRRPIQADRGFVEWEHHQKISENLTLLGQVNYWSDSEIIRDFRPDEFFQVQVPDSFLEGVYTGKNYVVSAFVRAQPNSFHRMQERLPEMRFDLLPTPIGGGIYERFNASAAVLRESMPTGGDTLNSDRFDAYYGLSRPIAPRDWLMIDPVVGGRLTHYARALDGRDNYTRALGEVGVDASLRASGVYAYQNERWDIDGIRHLVTPKISYRYIPGADKGREFIPAIDTMPFSTYLQPLDLGDRRDIDDLHPTNTIRLGLDNTFQTRDKNYGSRDLLAVNFAADYHIHREPGQRDFSEIHTDLAFTPTSWLQFNAYERFATQSMALQEFNTGFMIKDTNWWSLQLYNHYLQDQIHEYIIDGRYRLNEIYETYFRFHYDARMHRFVERSLGLRQNLDNLWVIQYGVSIYEGRRRESDFGFSVRVTLAGF